MKTRHAVPVILAAIWLAILGWQIAEHARFVEARRSMLRYRARDITNTLGVVIRSQRLFGGVIFQPRLESALYDLVQSPDLESIVLFNSMGEVVCAAGGLSDWISEWDLSSLNAEGERWEDESVTFVNFVDLGFDPRDDRPTIILSDEERGLFHQLRPPPPPDREGPPPPDGEPDRQPDGRWDEDGEPPAGGAGAIGEDREGDRDGRRGRGGPPWFRRPRWLDEDEYQALLQRAGLHGFTIELSTNILRMVELKDLWMRSAILGFSFLGVFGLWLAWRNLAQSSELRVRLVRANEMNNYLREMNLAAAGLAHETRNPLNLVRGLAQLIHKDGDAGPEIRERASRIANEVDRVTAQLNEFISYSKPREPKLVPVELAPLSEDVRRTLGTDLEDNEIELAVRVSDLRVEADERLLRQVIFNLALNAAQSAPRGGRIEIGADAPKSGQAVLWVRDNGPGVPEELRDKIFQPYFTTRERGAGLGLAVVHQIVLAHGWEIHCGGGTGGAEFRVTGMKTAE